MRVGTIVCCPLLEWRKPFTVSMASQSVICDAGLVHPTLTAPSFWAPGAASLAQCWYVLLVSMHRCRRRQSLQSAFPPHTRSKTCDTLLLAVCRQTLCLLASYFFCNASLLPPLLDEVISFAASVMLNYPQSNIQPNDNYSMLYRELHLSRYHLRRKKFRD